MKKTALLLTLLIALPAAGRGQTVAENLIKGKDAYEKSNVELAKNIFAGIIASKLQVLPEDKVTAFTYLGAYWALQSSPGAADSASGYFIAALDYDPFTDLDRTIFAADEQNAFARARRNIFKVGIKPITEPKALDPQSSDRNVNTFMFRIVATRSARITIELVNLRDSTQGKETFPTIGNLDAAREIEWKGLINTVRADSGIYEFRVIARDNIVQTAGAITETHKFRIEHYYSPLEDTLPAFGLTDTLTSLRPGIVPVLDGAKGLFVGGVAAALPFLALSQRSSMSGWSSHFGIGVALGLGGGVAAAWYGATHRDDGAAVADNARRRQRRAEFNAEVVARNRARLDKTILVIRPLTTAGVGG